MSEIFRFTHEMADGAFGDELERARRLDVLAEQVIDHGGYCDDLTFATIFYGGIHPKMNWSDSFENARASGRKMKPFKKVLKLVNRANFAIGEPFLSLRPEESLGSVENVGVVMPGEAEFHGPAVGFEVERFEGSYVGRVIFRAAGGSNTFSNKEVTYGNHTLATLERGWGGNTVERTLSRGLSFGVVAVRQQLSYYPGSRDSSDYRRLDDHLDWLRDEIRQHTAE